VKPAMALGFLALLFGVWAGLVRMGWALPVPADALAAAHGPLMVTGFVGTLIGVERAVGLRRRFAFAAPILLGVGSLAVLLPIPSGRTPGILVAGSAALLVLIVVLARRQPGVATATMAVGAGLLLAGNALWFTGRAVPEVVPWWLGFVVLFIAGERRELSRYLALSRATQGAFVAAVVVLLAGIAISLVDSDAGARLLAAGLVFVAAWLLVHDMASRNLTRVGLPRFTAIALLAGYAWLGAAGVATMSWGLRPAGLEYDAIVHSVFLGFAFSMIFAHGPIIFPAILRRSLAFTPALYVPLALLHLSLLLRIVGDLAADPTARMWGGLLNGIAIFAFLAGIAGSMRRRPA